MSVVHAALKYTGTPLGLRWLLHVEKVPIHKLSKVYAVFALCCFPKALLRENCRRMEMHEATPDAQQLSVMLRNEQGWVV